MTTIRLLDASGAVFYFVGDHAKTIELEADDGTVVVYKPLDTVRGPLLQVQEKRAAR